MKKIPSRRPVLILERLEDRSVPAAFTVLNNNDAGADSLRWAIDQANSSPGADIINFNIGGGGPQTIAVSSLLVVTDALTIDGSTQPGYAGAPLIELDGTGNGGRGVVSNAPLTMCGLVIGGFGGEGIALFGAGVAGSHIYGNYVGTNAAGTAAHANGNGIYLEGVNAAGNAVTIGGPTAPERNIIAGNVAHGIRVQQNSANVVIQGNYLGTDVSGSSAIAGTAGDILLYNGVTGATIRDNVISGAAGMGILGSGLGLC